MLKHLVDRHNLAFVYAPSKINKKVNNLNYQKEYNRNYQVKTLKKKTMEECSFSFTKALGVLYIHSRWFYYYLYNPNEKVKV